MVRFAPTIFLSAFLLFQVQPLIGKYILPWFGGGPSIWTACLLFFQTALLGGYAYAHLLNRLVAPRSQVLIHLGLLVLSLFLLPIAPEVGDAGPFGIGPTGRILVLLLATVGGPYLLLSSSGPLLQRWFSLAHPGRSPYRLYSLSNAGSLLALLSYPVLFEPLLDVGEQARIWSTAYLLFLAGTAFCAWPLLRRRGARPGIRIPDATAPATMPVGGLAIPRVLLWLALSASASALLMATTNQISLEMSVVPFLWILPLSAYLLSFVVTFDNPRWYDRRVFGPLLIATAGATIWVLEAQWEVGFVLQLVILCAMLFSGCMTCHGELYRTRPEPRHLTAYYLVVATGGAIGGFFVALVAPRVFLGYWELHVALAAVAAFSLVAWMLDRFGGSQRRVMALGIPLCLALGWLFVSLVADIRRIDPSTVRVLRNFYGVLEVEYDLDARGAYRALVHGQTIHGFQYEADSLRHVPTSYYDERSGIGLAMHYHPNRMGPAPSPLRVGVVGLGTGTLAAYGVRGDTIRFYEINPDVILLARSSFTFLSDTPAVVDVVEGDARLAMEGELERGAPGRYDILAIDAFSSGSIPVHLLTREAGEIYRQQLAPGGILAVHVSNHYLDLRPVVYGLGRYLDLVPLLLETYDDEEAGVYGSTWVLLTDNREFLDRDEVRMARSPDAGWGREPLLWTDAYAGLWHVLRF